MEDVMELDVKVMLREILKRAWIIVLCAVIAASATLLCTVNFVTPTYKASVTLYVNNSTDNTGVVSSQALSVALQLVKTYVNVIKSEAVLNQVIEKTGMNLTATEIREMLSAQSIEKTEMFEVSIISPNPQMSADIANAIANVAPGEISEIIQGSNAKVVDYARVPTERYGPNYFGNTILGGIFGVFLAVAAILVSLLLDNRVKNEDDLLRICQVPVLGTIPDFTESTEAYVAYGKKNERRRA